PHTGSDVLFFFHDTAATALYPLSLHDALPIYPALADPAFAKATTEVLIAETMALIESLLEGRIRPADRRSPFFALPFFRTDFWPLATTALALIAAAAIALLVRRSDR